MDITAKQSVVNENAWLHHRAQVDWWLMEG